jgi:large subunit ribosomal protein L10
LAFTKKEKVAIQENYLKWLKESQAVFVVNFNGMTMKDVDTLRAKARETGAHLHVVKNTLFARSLNEAQYPHAEYFEGTSLVGFAPNDAPALAKILADAAKGSEVFKVKGGYFEGKMIEASSVKALADLPPLPVMRAKLLGLFNTPATQLVRTLAEPARRLAYVVKAHSEKSAPQAA